MAKCICPKCKSDNIIPIAYGYPAKETMELADAGKVKLGGCQVYIDGCQMPDKFCKTCEHEWSMDHFVAEDIVKVRFRYWANWGFIDPHQETEEQWAYEIFPDGTIKYFAYPMGSRKVLDKEVAQISPEKVEDFYNEVIWLYRPWTDITECLVCDGSSYELTITYKDNRKRKLHGDIGGGTVDETIIRFLKTVPTIGWKFEDSDDEEEEVQKT